MIRWGHNQVPERPNRVEVERIVDADEDPI
jgi:hypothetical protein